MEELPEHCVPCRGDSDAMSTGTAQAYMQDLPHWTLDFPVLRRRFVLADFRKALAFTNRVGMLAEEEGHHPDIHITGYKHVELALTTHAVGGLSVNDFVLARKIDALAAKDGLA